MRIATGRLVAVTAAAFVVAVECSLVVLAAIGIWHGGWFGLAALAALVWAWRPACWAREPTSGGLYGGWLSLRRILRPQNKGGGQYLTRLHLAPRNRLFGAFFHLFHASDDADVLHDHPWGWSFSICLWGRGEEILADGTRLKIRPGTIFYRGGAHQHSVQLRAPTLATLFFTGRVCRPWFFFCRDGRKLRPSEFHAGGGCE